MSTATRADHDAVTDADAIAHERIGPVRMTAGSFVRWTDRFVARRDLPAGARIGVAHRWPSDWGIAQGGDPVAADYLEVETSTGAATRWWNARLHNWHPFDHIVFVELPDGLARGAAVDMRYGSDRHGSPGFRAQTFIEEDSPFSLRWQASADAPFVEFARATVAIVGAEPAKLVVQAASRARAGVAAEVHLRVEDRWGNPAALARPLEVDLADDGDPRHVARASIPAAGWARTTFTFGTAGLHRLLARSDGAGAFGATSNAVDVTVAPPGEQLWWGDLHGQSIIGCGARTIDAYYAHARDFAGADVASHQANCFLVSGDEWRDTAASTARHHAPGRFVTWLGVEWSGASNVGGDHNVYFPGDDADLHRCSHEFIADKSDLDSDLKHVEDLYRHYRGTDTLVAVHVGGRTADLRWHDPALDRLIEVHSTHATSEWFLLDALARGYKMGVIAGSDGVDGRPGNSHPGHLTVRNVRGGLTAITAPALTREALWKALKARHCYATSGERILLEFRCGGASMGDEFVLQRGATLPAFEVRVAGTAPIESVDFFRGTERIASVNLLAAACEAGRSNRLRVAWQGTSAQGNWQRARMHWDGGLQVEGARIVAVEGYAFDTPDEGILSTDAHAVRWRSVTGGDYDGVVVALDRPDDAVLAFATEPLTIRTPLARLGPAGRRFEATSPARALELRWLPGRMPAADFAHAFHDRSPPSGEHAYWVRVRQVDGAFAWSSPIFVGVAG